MRSCHWRVDTCPRSCCSRLPARRQPRPGGSPRSSRDWHRPGPDRRHAHGRGGHTQLRERRPSDRVSRTDAAGDSSSTMCRPAPISFGRSTRGFKPALVRLKSGRGLPAGRRLVLRSPTSTRRSRSATSPCSARRRAEPRRHHGRSEDDRGPADLRSRHRGGADRASSIPAPPVPAGRRSWSTAWKAGSSACRPPPSSKSRSTRMPYSAEFARPGPGPRRGDHQGGQRGLPRRVQLHVPRRPASTRATPSQTPAVARAAADLRGRLERADSRRQDDVVPAVTWTARRRTCGRSCTPPRPRARSRRSCRRPCGPSSCRGPSTTRRGRNTPCRCASRFRRERAERRRRRHDAARGVIELVGSRGPRSSTPIGPS